MQRRIAVWAGVGVVVACTWILWGLITPTRQVWLTLHDPAVRIVAMVSCPGLYAIRFVPLPFWLAVAMNGVTYALAGLIVEILRGKPKPTVAA